MKHNTHKSEKKFLYRNSKQNVDSEDLSKRQTSVATELDILRYNFLEYFYLKKNGVHIQLDAKCNMSSS